MGKVLQALIFSTLSACSTGQPARTLSAAQIMDRAKVELSSCWGINETRYDISIKQDRDRGWTVSAMPKRQPSRAGVIPASGGGDVHLFYDRFGGFKGRYRGQ